MTRLLPVVVVLSLASPAFADAPNPFDLVQGLREHNMPDLALEYLDELAKNNPSADAKIVIPLEAAKTRLLLAQLETDESVRDAAIAQSKTQFRLFLQDHPKHNRAAEANLALARVVSLQAKTALNRAARIDVPNGADGRPDAGKLAEKKAAYVAVRPQFKDATQLFGEAAKQIKEIVESASTDPFRKKSLAREAVQADLDRGINQFSLSETYFGAEGDDAIERANVLKQARQIFVNLGKEDSNNPLCWAARAWVGACDLELNDTGKAKETFQAIRFDGARNPVGADGVRMVEFFEAQDAYLKARGGGDLNAAKQARIKARGWLDKDKYKPRMTPERLSTTYYYAFLTQREGELDNGNNFDKKTNRLVSVSGNARSLLQEAAREYKRLQEFDNDYTDRAGRQRMRAVRFIVGDAGKPPSAYTNFDECLMAAQVRLAGLDDALAAIDKKAAGGPAEDDKKPQPINLSAKPDDKKPATPPAEPLTEDQVAAAKQKAMAAVIVLFERACRLITTATPAKDAAEAKLWLAIAYQRCDQPQAAAVAAEDVATTARGSLAAKAGQVAVDNYIESRKKIDGADAEAKLVDRGRAVAVGLAVEKANATDPAADRIRYRLGRLFFEEKQYPEAFAILARINVGYTDVSAARYTLGRTALFLLAANSPLTPEQKAETLQKAMVAAEAVPEPTNPAHLRTFFALRTVLAQLYLRQGGGSLSKAEAIAANVIQRAATAPMLEADKKSARYAAEEVRLRSLYAQAVPLFKEAKYKEVGEKLEKSLLELKKAGPAAAEVAAYRDKQGDKTEGDAGAAVENADSLDRFRRDFVGLAMQGAIRAGAFDQATELFKLLEQIGGSVEATTDALAKLVSQVRPQIDELKKEGKAEDAQKLMAAVGKLLTDQAGKEKLTARPRAFLGRSLRELGLYAEALDVLAKVPPAEAAVLAQPLAGLDPDKRDAVIAYQVGQIEQARVHRLMKQFDKADAVLTAALGPDGKSGWAKSLEFRKEKVYVLEDRADAGTAAAKRADWAKAAAGWSEVLKPYLDTVRAKIPPTADAARVRQDREKLYPVILDLFVEERRCFAKANTQLIAAEAPRKAAVNKLGTQVAVLEKNYAKGLTTEVRERYAALLAEYPDMKAGYQTAGGVAFLDPAAELPEPTSEKK